MEKRGISAIVATVLIILITVAGVAIIWVAVVPMITEKASFHDPNLRLDIIDSEGYTVYDSDLGLASVQVKRGVDEADLLGFDLIFDIDGESVKHFVNSTQLPAPNEARVYYVNLSNYTASPSVIRVAPVFTDGEVGNVISELKVKMREGNLEKLVNEKVVSFVKPDGGYSGGGGGDDGPGPSTGGECAFSLARWNKTSAAEGEAVGLIVEGSSCDGKQVDFTIYENDLWPFADELIVSLNATFGQANWAAVYVDDGLLQGNPEYYFVAYLAEKPDVSATSGELEVSQAAASCGDGAVGGIEACDDGNVSDGDGCSSLCAIEAGYNCSGEPSVCSIISGCSNDTGCSSVGGFCVGDLSYNCSLGVDGCFDRVNRSVCANGCAGGVCVVGGRCGDGNCDLATENCSSCEIDCSCEPLGLITTSEGLEQFGITWYFDKNLSTNGAIGTYQYGTFVNGDYWVVGPVNIVGIDPETEYDYFKNPEDLCTYETALGDCTAHNNEKYGLDIVNDYAANCELYSGHSGICSYTKMKHGLEINPNSHFQQALDARTSYLNRSLLVTLPRTVSPGSSVLKVISYENWNRPRLRNASVLTVLFTAPPNNGVDTFRPPYFGTEKTFYSYNDLNLNLLPSIDPGADVGSILDFTQYLRTTGYRRLVGVQLDHLEGAVGDYLHPSNNLPNDGGSIAVRNNEINLRLLLNDSIEDKKELLIEYVQYGIDLYQMAKTGQKWQGQGQVGPGRKIPITFAGVLLEDDEMKDLIRNAGEFDFGSNSDFRYTKESGRSLWYQDGIYMSEYGYWSDQTRTYISSKVEPDPYGYVDGGIFPAGSYLLSSEAQNAVGASISLYLFPELIEVWNDSEMIDFVNRWMYHGIWSQPDPCAPATGMCKSGTKNPGADCTTANVHEVCFNGNIFDYQVYSFTNGGILGSTITSCNYSAKWNSDYGVLYGPDGNGGCILDTNDSDGQGRFPWLQGFFKNGGSLGYPLWAYNLWHEYRDAECNWDDVLKRCRG